MIDNLDILDKLIPFSDGVSPLITPTGNHVLLSRIEATEHEIEMPDGTKKFLALHRTYATGGNASVIFRVLAVGPGGYVKGPRKLGGWQWVWCQPEVEPGDLCVSFHFYQQEEGGPQCHFLDNVDGTGRCIVDCRVILIKWKPTKQ